MDEGRARTSKFKSEILGRGHELLVSVISFNSDSESNCIWLMSGVLGPSAMGRNLARGDLLDAGERHLFLEFRLSTESGWRDFCSH